VASSEYPIPTSSTIDIIITTNGMIPGSELQIRSGTLPTTSSACAAVVTAVLFKKRGNGADNLVKHGADIKAFCRGLHGAERTSSMPML